MSLFDLRGAREYFSQLEKRYPAAALLDSGKLFHADGWGNVREHCLVQAAAWEIFGPMLGLTNQQTYELASTAVCHDWRKRIEKESDNFQQNEKMAAEAFFERMAFEKHISRRLFDCLTPRFNLRALAGEADFFEFLQWYVDDIAKGNELVSFSERIAEVESRNPDPEPEMMPELAGFGFTNYWDSEREIGVRVGQMIVDVLRARRIKILSPEEIPVMINAGIKNRIRGGKS